MDLPTYTSIWRIEKRLYKLYDFRLPMPLPVGQIAVFAAIAVPYVVVLTLLGLSFSHTLLWLYVLPPGVLAWLATRPVLESKRLPELIISQVRYLGEPRTWCRMAPLVEKDEINLTGRVWRRARPQPVVVHEQAVAPEAVRAQSAIPAASAAVPLGPVTTASAGRSTDVAVRQRFPAGGRHAAAARAGARPAKWPGTAIVPTPEVPSQVPAVAAQVPAPTPVEARGRPVTAPSPARAQAQAHAVPAWASRNPAQATAAPASPAAPAAPPAERPVVTVRSDPAPARPLRVVERALNGSSANRTDGWRDHVVVVPGGHRPGRPDQQQRDRARAQLPVSGRRRIVVLGCTVGAGQTVTTLMTGEVLASLRTDQVAVLDLNPGSGSLVERARTAPAVTQDFSPAARAPGPQRDGDQPPASRLEVIARSAADAQAEPAEDDTTKMFELVSARYPLTLADPAPAAVPRVLAIADQLVLVAPASADAASAIAMTYEWLEAHGRARLAAEAITVLNGVSRHTMRYVEQAEAVARGRCRAMVRVPWDDRLQNPEPEPAGLPAPGPQPQRAPGGPLSPAAVHAYTALAGLLVAGLADTPELRRARI